MAEERFRYFLRVRYAECDAQKVVFNARYGDYVDLAMGEYVRALGFAEPMVSGELEVQLVKQTTQWFAPARYDQVLEVSVATTHLGTTSFTLTTQFRLAGQEKILATSETVYVHVDRNLIKAPIPHGLRAALERGAAGVSIDHAGYLEACG